MKQATPLIEMAPLICVVTIFAGGRAACAPSSEAGGEEEVGCAFRR
jgi:hypothetical protein